jgi:site-specific DNA recombinase
VRAHGYVRLSRADQDSTSPQRQRQAIQAYCRAHKLELAHVYEDLDVSGRSDKRPGLDAMLANLNGVDRIVVWRLDRLYRSMVGFARTVEALQKADVGLVSASEPFDTASPMGEALMWLLGTFAQLEVRTMSERSKNMHEYLKANGKWATSQVPLGWKKTNGSLEVDSEGQEALQAMATAYAGGESLRALGKRFGYSHAGVREILRSDRTLEALPPELSSALRSALRENRPAVKPTASLLGGLGRCGVCGAPLKVFAKRPPRGGRTYGCREKGCVYIDADSLDAYVSEAVLGAIDTKKLAKRMRQPKRRSERADLEARLERLEDDYYQRGILGEKSYLRQREALLKRMEDASENDTSAPLFPVELAVNLVSHWPSLTVSEQRRIVSAVLETVTVNRAKTKGRIDPSRVGLNWRI